jgi:hypothetical protein
MNTINQPSFAEIVRYMDNVANEYGCEFDRPALMNDLSHARHLLRLPKVQRIRIAERLALCYLQAEGWL